jgi:membrane protease YdiL (CAAX protease family)
MLPEVDHRNGAGARETVAWVLGEVAWFAAILTASLSLALGARAVGASPQAAALFAFHAGLLVYSALRARSRLGAWFGPTRAALTWGLGVGVAMTVTGGVYGTLLRLAGIELPDVAQTLRELIPSSTVLVAWGALVVPVAEELYFRGYLLDGARARLGLRAAVALTAVVFALVHGVPILIPAYLGFAWLLWIARERSGGLLAPVIAHALNNLVGLLAPASAP